MEKKKISLFYIILPVFLLLLLAVFLFIRFAVLRPWLVRFESSQPKHASQEVFAELFSRRTGTKSMIWPAWRRTGSALSRRWRR